MRTRARQGALVLLALAVVATLGVLVVRRARTIGPGAVRAMATTPTKATRGATYDSALEELRARRRQAEVLSGSSPESFSRYAQAAGYQLDYGQLTGDYDGYEAAQRSLDEAFAAARRRDSAGADTGPFLLQAQLDYTLHRFDKTMADLGAPEREATFFHDTPLLAEVKALRGAATFARGQYAEGLALLREAKALDDNASHAQRLALALAKVGAEDEAVRLFDDVEGSVATPRGRAWLSLQRGLLDLHRGRRASARQRLERARAFFPGFWLVEEHIAELDADEGRSDEATAGYRSLVARTGDPEFMDALARLVERNSPEEARALVARSSAIYEERLKRLPEASYGHALEHYLRMDPEPARAVAIAEKNRTIRPDGEARTRLAQAYLRAGRSADARAEIDRVIATSWSSGETWATAALVFGACGDAAASTEASAKAKAIDPFASESVAWLAHAPR